MMKKGSVQSRLWCFTLNNFTTTEISDSLLAEITYAKWGEETAPTTGTPHLQGVIYFAKKKTLKAITSANFWDGHHPKLLMCRGTLQQNDIYCSKGGLYHEFGVKPANPGEIGRDSQITRWERIRELAKAPSFEMETLLDTDPELAYNDRGRMQALRAHLRPVPVARDTLDNYWFVGKSGTGKSRYARTEWPEHYVITTLQWFPEPFQYEPVLIIDEVTPGSVSFVELSRMADHYPVVPAYKGGFHGRYRPQTVIVTSNYTIEQCYPGIDTAAIKRRFKVVDFDRIPLDAPRRGPSGSASGASS